jgi:(2R)-3-sulfolactate dehydrogenase (NADP+)
MPNVSLDAIETTAHQALVRCGAAEAVAASVAKSVRRAEADGIGPVGLGYLPTYLAHLKSGKVDGQARPIVALPRPAVVTVDACHGFAHPAFDAGLPPLIAAAHCMGTATLSIRRSYSIGVLGHPVEDIAQQGLLALAMTNSPPNIAPTGGRRPLFGTNPIALAVPRASAPPLVIDQATSVVTKVALVAAAKGGGPIPSGWALDRDGLPTTDGAAALQGSMAAIGGAKGANLALIVDILAAALTGASFSKDASAYARADGPPPGVGQLVMAFDPDAFAPGFVARVEDLMAAMLADEGVRLPGDRRLEMRTQTTQMGVEVDDALWAMILREAAP